METPDGERHLWESHGLISECMRASDEPRQNWLDFINSDVTVRRAWCEQMAYAHNRSTASLAGFVEDVNRLLDTPCT